MQLQRKNVTGEFIIVAALILISSSLVLNLMKINSISIILFALGILFSYKSWSNFKVHIFDIATLCYFFVVLTGLLVTSDSKLELKNIESKLAFLIFPILFIIIRLNNSKFLKVFFYSLVFSTCVASLYCLIQAFIHFIDQGDSSYFFYHELLSPLNHHAVYFSIAILFSIIYIIEDKSFLENNMILKWGIVSFLALVLFLLSSKLMIVFSLVVFGFILVNKLKRSLIIAFSISSTLLFIAVFSFKNPISNRFYDLASTDISVITKEEIGRDYYLNGFEFRLLQWRNTYDILNRYDAWWTGVSFSNSSKRLWEQYDHLKLYKGENENEVGGYYVYDLHNQYLQTTFQHGILGLIALLFFYIAMLIDAIRKRSILYLTVSVLLLILSFTENILERQYGMILFVLIPLFLSSSNYHEYIRKKKAV